MVHYDKARESKLPEALYCANVYCADEVSYPPEDLAWCDAHDNEAAGWYCYNCCDASHKHTDDDGEPLDREVVNLADEIERREGVK